MRINSTNIPTQVSRSQSTSPNSKSADQIPERQQALREESYQRNASTSAPIIDAEYVEFYTPSPKNFAQERQTLDSRIEVETSGEQYQARATSSGKTGPYQMQNHQAPPPGTFIDTFA
ncbi:hypothetical protein SAMN02745165_00697 [Malonomonas rubra DSM 5091]|uniref:Uncharacterized protein n=1 Tax=Malonomonas rubra DSM 5091 TaxID=1122189 RepID=A0A1M6DJ75_MALRU|nr:hypothetical protein [Malonomonas rubra]SHI73109.1 hypothetical protein SAMN02745165_00697 [Malonomonas rubra DSM 5091]